MIICEPSRCCGCMACADVCRAGAISAEYDEYGFMRPKVDETLCVNCGLCSKACPLNCTEGKDADEVYAAYSKNTDERLRSSSGGVFALLAENVLANGGYVCGAGFDEEFNAVHKIINDEKDLSDLMGSKYVQSNTSGIWKRIKELLDGGEYVMFTGTPCQCAALTSYLDKDYEKLLKVDIICHGVPSPGIWRKYLDSTFGNVKKVMFRDKKHGWHMFSMKVEGDKEKYESSLYSDPYFRLFFGNYTLRESCFECRFKGEGYQSDLTVGDFWGINTFDSAMNDNKGVSAVMIRTEKGRKAFSDISGLLVYRAGGKESLLRGNPAVVKSAAVMPGRAECMEMIRNGEPFEKITSRFAKPKSVGFIIKTEARFKLATAYGRIKKILHGKI